MKSNQKPVNTTSEHTTLKTCPVAYLTAAQQQVVEPERYRTDPSGAAMDSAQYHITQADELGVDLELAAAIPVPNNQNVNELDPCGAHLDIDSCVDGSGHDLSEENAKRIEDWCGDGETGVKIRSLATCDNLFHPDPKIRAQIRAHHVRAAKAQARLATVGCKALTIFIGADPTVSQEANMEAVASDLCSKGGFFEQIRDAGGHLRIENCPMPGQVPGDHYFNNLGYCAGNWVQIFQIADSHGFGDLLGLNYDLSHDILMGNRPEQSFMVLEAGGYAKKLESMHAKDQHVHRAHVAAYTYHGRRIGLPHDWAVMVANHGMPGICFYNPEAMTAGLQGDFMAEQIYMRMMGLNPEEIPFILEHEWNPNRLQDKKRIREMFELSVQWVRGLEMMAAVHYQSEAWVAQYADACDASGKTKLALPGRMSDLFRKPEGLAEFVATIGA
jgi:sugar phosphate isomerase/epimerase